MRHRYPWAVMGGLLLASAFPKLSSAGLAWVAPGFIVAAALGKAGLNAFRIGYVAGLTHYLASLYWLLMIPYRWHGIPLGPAAGWLALSAVLALYPACWVWLMTTTHGGLDELPIPTGPLASRWFQRALWAFSGAVAWAGIEMILARFLSGFPLNLLGASQFQMLPIIQIASLTGIYGVSFLVVWFSLSLLCAALMIFRQPGQRAVWVTELLLPLTVLAVVFNAGFHRLRPPAPAPRTLKVAFIQPSIPQTLIWDESRADERFGDLRRLTQLALTNHPDLLLWPEAAVPKLLRYREEMLGPITGLARSNGVWMIIGADDMEPARNPTSADDRDYFNSSFLINPAGELAGRYCKRNLVIFGEYIPLVRWLPFVKWFTPIEGGFTPGKHPVQFRLPDLGVTLAPLICFEDIFPHFVREYVDDDTDLLVNLTNNGWFGEGALHWQHASAGIFRAIENGVPLLRCSNNGLTFWVDERGRLRDVFRDARGTIYGPGFMIAEIPLPAPGEKHAPTFYHRHGDAFGWICVAGTAVLVLSRVWEWRRRRAARG